MKRLNNLLTFIAIISGLLFILTLSILPPLIDRNFYYIQIEPLGIEEYSNMSKENIITAFNDVMDFIWNNDEFNKSGVVVASESGISHFEDCKMLFKLDLYVLIISSIVLAALLILHFTKVIRLQRYENLPFIFYSSVFLLGLLLIIGIFGLIDFDALFEGFHKLFFPGKDNWLFNPRYDSVILILPEDFFMNCAILIGADLFILTSSSIIYSFIVKKKATHK